MTAPIILVTGASSGLGEAIARRLAADGSRVGVGYHSGAERAAAVVDDIRAAGGAAVAVAGNLSKEADVADAFRQLDVAFGPVTGVVINAGVQADAAFGEMSFEAWRKVMAIDFDRAFLTSREAVRHFDARDPDGPAPALVFVTSVHAWIPWAGHVNYAAAKGGVEMLMRSLAQGVAGRASGSTPSPPAPSARRSTKTSGETRPGLRRFWSSCPTAGSARATTSRAPWPGCFRPPRITSSAPRLPWMGA